MAGKDAKGRVALRLEEFFYWWGCTVATHPLKVILATLVVTGLSSVGLLNFNSEMDGVKMMLPEGSRHSLVETWKENYFTEEIRATITIFSHEENILTSEGLLRLLDLHQEVAAVEFDGGNYTRACLKIPITNILLQDKRRKKRQVAVEVADPLDNPNYLDYQEEYMNFYGNQEIEDNDDDSVDTFENLPKDIYCDIVETLQDKCGEYSLLEIWKYDKVVISQLSDQDIINAINTLRESPIFGYSTDYINYLGGVEYNLTGHAVKARSVRSIWLEKFDSKNIPEKKLFEAGHDQDRADPFTMGYEQTLLKVLQSWSEKLNEEDEGYSLFMNLGLSFSTEASEPVKHDVKRQIVGYILMFSYTLLSLGKLNLVENKLYLAGAGITSVFFGYIVGTSLSSAIGLIYTPVSGILPFICLGVGIDDMFVIMRCFNNIPEAEKKTNSIVHNIGLALKHAGTAITVTSLTDICAFMSGGLTYFVAGKSFCIGGAIAITAIFLFQTSWFVAWLTLDQQRIQQKRNGIIPCLVHKEWQPPKWSQNDNSTLAMSKIASIFEFPIFQAFIIFITFGMLSLGICGALQIQIEYDFKTAVPDDSYLKAWFDKNEIDFSTDGYGVDFYTQNTSYTIEDFEKIDNLVNQLVDLTQSHSEWVHFGKELPKTLQTPWEVASGFWWSDFKTFLNKTKDIQIWREGFSDGLFPLHFSDFLHHEYGSIYNTHFRFSSDLKCNKDAPNITAMKLGTLKFRDLRGLSNHLPAQKAITEILSQSNLSSKTFEYSYIYPAWEIEEILSNELVPNISASLACVIIIILITLADFRATLFTFACVLFTIVDVVGVIFYWDMSIDVTVLLGIIVGIGLCVDYGAHIAHSFVMSKGLKNQRAIASFVYIGPAIVHGGASTFLAIIPLAFSESHAFITFFRMICLTVLLGLFHGLFFLTIMLSIFGTNNLGETNEEKHLKGRTNQACSNDSNDSNDSHVIEEKVSNGLRRYSEQVSYRNNNEKNVLRRNSVHNVFYGTNDLLA